MAGRIGVDLTSEPLGTGSDGQDVYLADIWPTAEEVRAVVGAAVDAEMYEAEYARVWDGDEHWQAMDAPSGALFDWAPESTYVREPPYFVDLTAEPAPVADIVGARLLAVLGDSVTTDHISPAGAIKVDSPAGRYLREHGVEPREFNSYGSRRGNHEVMVRGTFANIRLRNRLLAPETEGPVTEHLPTGERLSIYDAAERYRAEGTPLIVVAGSEYGSGSSRDWAAKGTLLLGVRAVIAESYERIHRSNLVGMGVLPLQFLPGESLATHGLSGLETFTIRGLDDLEPRQTLTVEATSNDGTPKRFDVVARVDGPVELTYLRHGGILPMVLRRMLASG